jgi:threonine/homoserine/homoserine lactone efflux protein
LQELILKAVGTGLILSLMIGPAFFLLLETSIKKGIRAALSFDLGVLISDLIYILIAYIFYAEVSKLIDGEHTENLKLIGGILFLIYGLVSIFKNKKLNHQKKLKIQIPTLKNT